MRSALEQNIAGFTLAELSKSGGWSLREYTYVRPEFRGKGIASKLVQLHETYCRFKRIYEIESYVSVNNIPMQNLLEHLKYPRGKTFIAYHKSLDPQ